MRVIWLLPLVSLLSCDSLWGSYNGNNPSNCVVTPAVCGAGFVCDQTTGVCEKPCMSYADCKTPGSVCNAGTCESCSALAPQDVVSQCSQLPPQGTLRACVNASCVQCAVASDCTDDASSCTKNQCTNVCTQHSDCASNLCDVYQTNSAGGTGKCLSGQTVVYVDNANGTCTGTTHAGTKSDPVCQIGDALNLISGSKINIRVMPSTTSYSSITVKGGTVAFYGGFGGTGETIISDSANPGIVVNAGSTVIVDGIVVNNSAQGVSCPSGANLQLRRSQVQATMGVGVNINGCTFAMDRVLLTQGTNTALSLSGNTTYAVTNSFITGNQSGANSTITIGGTSTGTFQFNTVGGNLSTVSAMDCGQAMRNVEDSIFIGNGMFGMTQLAANCVPLKTVLGTADHNTGAGAILKDPVFVAPASPTYNYNLIKDNPNDLACCIAKGDALANIKTDYYGDSRPQGMYDIGADQVN